MTGQDQTTTTDNAINTLLEHGLAEGLPRIAEMLLKSADRNRLFSLVVYTT